jgi:hypothetical protein
VSVRTAPATAAPTGRRSMAVPGAASAPRTRIDASVAAGNWRSGMAATNERVGAWSSSVNRIGCDRSTRPDASSNSTQMRSTQRGRTCTHLSELCVAGRESVDGHRREQCNAAVVECASNHQHRFSLLRHRCAVGQRVTRVRAGACRHGADGARGQHAVVRVRADPRKTVAHQVATRTGADRRVAEGASRPSIHIVSRHADAAIGKWIAGIDAGGTAAGRVSAPNGMRELMRHKVGRLTGVAEPADIDHRRRARPGSERGQ